MPNPKPRNLEERNAQKKVPEGYKSHPLRILTTLEAWHAFEALTPTERGEVVERWFKEQK